MKEYDIIIIGAGPAGSAAAIQIANRNPGLATHTLVLEKCAFPRVKLCAGGVTQHADDLLSYLGVSVDTPSVQVNALRFVFEELEFTLNWPKAFRVVRREEFDTALARAAQAHGVELREGEPVVALDREGTGVTVVTSSGEYRARTVIGADGANSVVRQRLGLVRWDRISRLLEILTPADATQALEFVEKLAVFDFTPILRGVQGYAWDFPSIKQGVAMVNRGLFDARVHPNRPQANLKPVFDTGLRVRGVDPGATRLMGHPERWFDSRAPHSVPRIVLAGDAAGVEPLLGEGISHALNFGVLAAEAVLDAFRRDDFSFESYNRMLSRSALGRRLWLKRLAAQLFYGRRARWQFRLAWRVCQVVFG